VAIVVGARRDRQRDGNGGAAQQRRQPPDRFSTRNAAGHGAGKIVQPMIHR
jgi:hypothetical protein